jgi:hypothetical protein
MFNWLQETAADVFNKITGRAKKFRGQGNNYKPKGYFTVQHLDKDGNVKATYKFPNDITNEGKNTIFDVMFHDATQIASTSWYIGLISNSGYTALAASDTMGSHGGWTESTAYSQSTRVAWGPGAASSQATTNSSPATFDMTGTATIKGVFITSNSTKGGTSGKLWATALFSADVPVVNGDQLKITYTVSA